MTEPSDSDPGSGPSASPDVPLEREAEAIAIRLLAQNALAALRGPMSRGAVPMKRLAEELGRPRNTVTRLVARSSGRVAQPLDLAVRHTFDADRNGHQQLWDAGLSMFREGAMSFRGPDIGADDPDMLRKVVSEMLAASFTYQATSEFRLTLVNSYILQSAAVACERDQLDEAAARARDAVLDACKQSDDRSTAIYKQALRLVLRGASRRPKSGYSEEDIIVALHSLYQGYMLRHLVDPERYRIRLLVDTLWDLAVAMTEPGVLQASGGSDSVRDDLARALLAAVRTNGVVPTIDETALASGLEPKVARELFPDAQRLAEHSLDVALAGTAALRELAAGVRGSGLALLEELLRSVGEIADNYRALVDLLADRSAWTELQALAVRLMEAAGDEICAVDKPAVAEILITAAMRGSAGEQQWCTALEMLRARPADPPPTSG